MWFRNGEPATFKRGAWKRFFPRRDRVPLALTAVRYAAGGGAEIRGADNGDDIQGLVFAHFHGQAFFDALYELARQTRSILLLIVPNHPIAATDQETVDHLPPGFAQGLSTPVIISSGRELLDCLFGHD